MPQIRDDMFQCGVPGKSHSGRRLRSRGTDACQHLSDPQRIMMWSSGLAVFSGVSDKKQTLKKVMTHPCILACILGIIFMFAGVELPLGLDGMVTALGNCNTAMSMMVIGMILADINPKDFWDLTVVKYTVHRLIVIPGSYILPAVSFLWIERLLGSVFFWRQCRQAPQRVYWRKNMTWNRLLQRRW